MAILQGQNKFGAMGWSLRGFRPDVPVAEMRLQLRGPGSLSGAEDFEPGLGENLGVGADRLAVIVFDFFR